MFKKVLSLITLMMILVTAQESVFYEQPFYLESSTFIEDIGEATIKIYATQTAVRTEIIAEDAEMAAFGFYSVLIYEDGQLINRTLNPSMNMAIEMTDSGATLGGTFPLNSDKHPCNTGQWTCEKLADEDLNGRSSQKWLMKGTPTGDSTTWIDKELGVALKSESENGATQFTKLELGPQDESLFVFPEDTEFMSIPSMGQ